MTKAFSTSAFRRAWFDASLTAQDLADRFGVCRRTIIRRGELLGLPPRGHGLYNRKIRDDETFRLLWQASFACEAIADFFGCSVRAVRYRASKLGLQDRRFRGVKAPVSTMTVDRFLEAHLASVYASNLAASGRETLRAMSASEMLDFHRADRIAAE